MSDKPKIFYLCPDNARPSWGLGIIYYHVKALTDAGYEAYLVHEKAYFNVDWLNVRVPVLYWNKLPVIKDDDILVVPEVLVGINKLKEVNCRKILFVQATSFLFEQLPGSETHKSLGFDSAIGVMPHMLPIIKKYTGLPVSLIPPFVAPYFFKDNQSLHSRDQLVLIFPKFHQQDFGIVKRLIGDRLDIMNSSGVLSANKKNWKLVVLEGKSHKQVAALMQQASFFIATNTFESFNASVVEAMAAGCINLCYEAFGPKDYLRDGENAFVFSNNEVFSLIDKSVDLIESYPANSACLQSVRLNAFELAKTYSFGQTKNTLIKYFKEEVAA